MTSLKYFYASQPGELESSVTKMNAATTRRSGKGRPIISMILGLLFVAIGLYELIAATASLTLGLLTLIVGLLSCGLALYRILYLRGLSNA